MQKFDISSFFKSDKSTIVLFYNKESVKNVFNIDNGNDSLFFWHFFYFREKTQKINLVKLKLNCEFYFKKNKIDLVKIDYIFKKTYAKWKKEVGLKFPDISFTHPKHGKASIGKSLFNKDPGVIYLSIDLLLDPKSLEFSLCHELGHLYYNEKIKNDNNKKIEFKNYFKNYGSMFFYSIFLVNIPGFLDIIKSDLHPLIKGLVFLGLVPALYLEGGSLFSYKERLSNYSQEFFSDFFASFFIKENIDEKEIFKSNFIKYNCYSHPSDVLRIKSLLTNKDRPLEKWENLVFSEPSLFIRSNYFELFVFWEKKFKIINYLFSKGK